MRGSPFPERGIRVPQSDSRVYPSGSRLQVQGLPVPISRPPTGSAPEVVVVERNPEGRPVLLHGPYSVPLALTAPVRGPPARRPPLRPSGLTGVVVATTVTPSRGGVLEGVLPSLRPPLPPGPPVESASGYPVPGIDPGRHDSPFSPDPRPLPSSPSCHGSPRSLRYAFRGSRTLSPLLSTDRDLSGYVGEVRGSPRGRRDDKTVGKAFQSLPPFFCESHPLPHCACLFPGSSTRVMSLTPPTLYGPTSAVRHAPTVSTRDPETLVSSLSS